MSQSVRPVTQGAISNTFAQHRARRSVNPGVDFAVAVGTPVLSPKAGRVAQSKNGNGPAGNFITIYHDDGTSSDLLHLSRRDVSAGARVQAGQQVGLSGRSGNVDPHLHWTLRTQQVTSLSNAGNIDPLTTLGTSSPFSQVTKDRQHFLTSRGWQLTIDGIEGPATRQAYGEYQTYLRSRGWYAGAVDGIWGPGTQAAHERFWAELHPPTPTPAPVSSGVPSHLRWPGIAAMLRKLYGYRGNDTPGPVMVAAFQRFLNATGRGAGIADGVWGPNTAKATQRWLKQVHGYTGHIDGVFGDGSTAAWVRAEHANWKAFK